MIMLANHPIVTLRPVHLSDLDDFMAWATDDRVSRFCQWDTFTSRDQVLDFLKNKAMVHPWYRVICVDDGHAVGAIYVTPGSGHDRCRAEVSYALAYEHWGRGIATEALKMVTRTIFKEWPHLEKLEAYVAAGNVGSEKVLEKAGFVKEGVLRKHMILNGRSSDFGIFSFLSSDPLRD